MPATIEFFFDYGSPFSYLADTQLPAMAGRCGAEIIYRPMLLIGVFKATGNASPIAVPAKAQYTMRELPRWATRYGVPFKLNPAFPFSTVRLLRGAIAAQLQGKFAAYHDTTFRAFWAEGRDLSKENELERILKTAGIEPDSIEGTEIKDSVRVNTDEAIARGAFGAPTFFVNGEMYFGNDRLDFVESAARDSTRSH
jgi:2-hydroxychromene-2-carboxylate isomerase